MATQRLRPVHKLHVEKEHMRAHWNDDCDCYSFQDACAMCSVSRAMNRNSMIGECIFDEFMDDITFIVDGKDYLPNKYTSEWLQSFYKPIWNYRPNECVLLFLPDQTVDIREIED